MGRILFSGGVHVSNEKKMALHKAAINNSMYTKMFSSISCESVHLRVVHVRVDRNEFMQ